MSGLTWQDLGKIFFDFIREIIYFPLWWYSGGVKKFWQWAWGRICRAEDILAFWIMFRNLYRPLYGDYSFIGIIIGPLIRLSWFFLISLAMLLVLFFFVAFFCVYLALLPLCVYMIIT